MPDKDKNDNVDHKKMLKEEDLEEKVVEMLIKEYGYSKSQIKKGYHTILGSHLGLEMIKTPHVLDVVQFLIHPESKCSSYCH